MIHLSGLQAGIRRRAPLKLPPKPSCANPLLFNAYAAVLVRCTRLSYKQRDRSCCEQGLGSFARLAYPACAMECSEIFFFGFEVVLAGLLPNPVQAVGALGIVLEIYGCLIQTPLAQMITVSTRSESCMKRSRCTPCIAISTGKSYAP